MMALVLSDRPCSAPCMQLGRKPAVSRRSGEQKTPRFPPKTRTRTKTPSTSTKAAAARNGQGDPGRCFHLHQQPGRRAVATPLTTRPVVSRRTSSTQLLVGLDLPAGWPRRLISRPQANIRNASPARPGRPDTRRTCGRRAGTYAHGRGGCVHYAKSVAAAGRRRRRRVSLSRVVWRRRVRSRFGGGFHLVRRSCLA